MRFGEKDQFLWRTISVGCTSCVGRAGRSQRAWMSWSTKGTRLRPTSCQAWSTPTSRTRRGVDTLEILHDDGSRTNVWPNRSECGFSRARWNWYSSSLADRTNLRYESPSIKCGFRCESSAWSEPVPTRIASATIHSRGRDSCSGLVFACSTVLDAVLLGVHGVH